MSIRSIALVAATFIATGLTAGPALSGAADVQILPDGRVIFVNLEGTTEVCMDPQDPRTCRLLKNRCDFVVANKKNRQITEPEPISAEAILLYSGPEAVPYFVQEKSELVKSFTFGKNECNLTLAKALIQDERPDNDPDPQPGSPN